MVISTIKEGLVSKETVEKWSYRRLTDRMKELDALYRQDSDAEHSMEQYGISSLFECEGLETYETIALFCQFNNVKRVIDIGCAYGHQSEVFAQVDIDYVGVNDGSLEFWNDDKFTFMQGIYPCKLPVQEGDLGVSVLCLTWNCYLYDKENSLIEQCEALRNDFEHCLIYVQPSHLNVLSEYFKHVRQVSGNLHYFSNKQQDILGGEGI